MRRVQKVLSGIFLGGVLLGGIGTGVALVEYSSLAYAGEKRLGEENLVTRKLDYSIAPEEEEVWLIKSYWDEAAVEADASVPEGIIRYEITYDEKRVKPILNYEEDTDREEEFSREEEGGLEGTKAEGVVEAEEGILESTETEPEAGKGAQAEPGAGKDAQGKAGTEESVKKEPDKRRRKTLLHLNIRYTSSDFAVWMACKDEILTELKKRRIFSYDMTPVTELKIKVNPRTMPLVHREDSRIY